MNKVGCQVIITMFIAEKIYIKYIEIKNKVIVNKIKCAIIKTKTNK